MPICVQSSQTRVGEVFIHVLMGGGMGRGTEESDRIIFCSYYLLNYVPGGEGLSGEKMGSFS